MLRSRFESVPSAFSRRLVPSVEKGSRKKEMVVANLVSVWHNAIWCGEIPVDFLPNRNVFPYQIEANFIPNTGFCNMISSPCLLCLWLKMAFHYGRMRKPYGRTLPISLKCGMNLYIL